MVLWTQVLGEVFKSLTELLYLLPSNLARFSCGDLRSKSEITCLCAQGDLRFDLGGTPLGAGSVQRHRDGAEWVPVGGVREMPRNGLSAGSSSVSSCGVGPQTNRCSEPFLFSLVLDERVHLAHWNWSFSFRNWSVRQRYVRTHTQSPFSEGVCL